MAVFFDFNGAYFSSYTLYDVLQSDSATVLTLEGLNGATVVDSLTVNLNIGYDWIQADFLGITSLRLTSSNGIIEPERTRWMIDDFTFNATPSTHVPEPATLALSRGQLLLNIDSAALNAGMGRARLTLDVEDDARRLVDPGDELHVLGLAIAHDRALEFLGLDRFDAIDGVPIPIPYGQQEALQGDAISGALMLVRRDAFQAARGFDEGYFMHAEDLDLCRRIRELGFEVWCDPAVRVVHVKGVSSRRRPLRVELAKHRGLLRYFGCTSLTTTSQCSSSSAKRACSSASNALRSA